MASKRQPSKQKRAAQNRSERNARVARAANANAVATTGPAAAPSGGASLLSRLRGGGSAGARPTSSGGAGSRPPMREARSMQPPGYRAALSAVFAAVAAILLCSFALRYPVDSEGTLYTSEKLVADWSMTAADAVAEQPDASAAEISESIDEWAPGRTKEPVVMALWPFSAAVVLPLVGAGIAFHAVRKRSSSKVMNRALYATLFGAVLTQGLLLLFLPVVLAVGVAMFQVRKAEAVAAASAAPAGGVIDVDEVDDGDADLISGVDEVDEVDEVAARDIEHRR